MDSPGAGWRWRNLSPVRAPFVKFCFRSRRKILALQSLFNHQYFFTHAAPRDAAAPPTRPAGVARPIRATWRMPAPRAFTPSAFPHPRSTRSRTQTRRALKNINGDKHASHTRLYSSTFRLIRRPAGARPAPARAADQEPGAGPGHGGGQSGRRARAGRGLARQTGARDRALHGGRRHRQHRARRQPAPGRDLETERGGREQARRGRPGGRGERGARRPRRLHAAAGLGLDVHREPVHPCPTA